jgi:predicted HicB family RNase H-like nuclease
MAQEIEIDKSDVTKITVALRIHEKVWQAIAKMANAEGTSMSDWVEQAILLRIQELWIVAKNLGLAKGVGEDEE